MKPGATTVIIGTLYIEQKKKPCVFENIAGVIDAVKAVECSTG